METSAYGLQRHAFDPVLVHDDGLWGVIGRSMRSIDALQLGRFWGMRLRASQQRMVCTGRDTDPTSIILETELCRGLLEAGLWVVRMGLCATPVTLFAAQQLKVGAVAMVTVGQHPRGCGGFRLFDRGQIVTTGYLQGLLRSAFYGMTITDRTQEAGVIDTTIDDAYIDFVLQRPGTSTPISAIAPRTVVWDCTGGATGGLVKKLAGRLKGEHLVLHDQLDPIEDSRNLNTTKAYEAASSVVRSEKAALGIVVSRDGSALRFIDQQGTPWLPYAIAAVLLRRIARRMDQGTVVLGIEAPHALVQWVRSQKIDLRFCDESVGDLTRVCQQISWPSLHLDTTQSPSITTPAHNFGKSPSLPKLTNPQQSTPTAKERIVFGADGAGHIVLPDSPQSAPDAFVNALTWLSQTNIELADSQLNAPYGQSHLVKLEVSSAQAQYDWHRRLLNAVERLQPSIRAGHSWRYEDDRGWWSISSPPAHQLIRLSYEGVDEHKTQLILSDIHHMLLQQGCRSKGPHLFEADS